MAQQEVSPVQIQMAAAAGQRLLQEKDLAVPLEIAKSGALGVLEGLLGAIARGELVVSAAPEQEGDGEPTNPPGLERIEGGKQD